MQGNDCYFFETVERAKAGPFGLQRKLLGRVLLSDVTRLLMTAPVLYMYSFSISFHGDFSHLSLVSAICTVSVNLHS